MSNITRTGNVGPFIQRRRPVWKRGIGWSTAIEWEGAEDAIRALVPSLLVDADEVQLSLDGPVGGATAIYNREVVANADTSVQSNAEVTWDLDGNDVSRDLFDHPGISGLSNDQIIALKAQIAQFDTGGTVNISGFSAAQLEFFALAIKGTRQYLAPQYVLTKTKVVDRSYNQRANLTGVLQRWTTEQILADPDADKMLFFDTVQISAPAGIPSAYSWSWLKKVPRVSRSSRGRFQLTEAWMLDAWSTTIYAAHT